MCPTGGAKLGPGLGGRGALREPCGGRTNHDPARLAVLRGRASLQPLVDLVCGQVKEVQVIFHGVAVPQPVPQANDSYKNQEMGITEDKTATAGLLASQGGTERDPRASCSSQGSAQSSAEGAAGRGAAVTGHPPLTH